SRLGKPIIAMVNGHALGGGLGLVAACDLALASEDAQFGTPEINVGLWPMIIMAQLARNLPRKRLLELMLLGDRVDARAAELMGLINRVVAAADLESETIALARRLASQSPAARRLGLRAFYDTQDSTLADARSSLERQRRRVLGTDDAREGIAAFGEHRPPRWTDR